MVAAAKRKEPTQEEREAALLDEINMLRSKLDQFIADRAMGFKRSRDGAGLPIEVIRAGLTRNEPCLCRCAARLCGDPNA